MHWCVNELPDNIWLLHLREKLINLSSIDELMNSEHKGMEKEDLMRNKSPTYATEIINKKKARMRIVANILLK